MLYNRLFQVLILKKHNYTVFLHTNSLYTKKKTYLCSGNRVVIISKCEIVVFREVICSDARKSQIIVSNNNNLFYIPSNFELDIRLVENVPQ